MHSATCSSSLPRSLPDRGSHICFPLQDTLISCGILTLTTSRAAEGLNFISRWQPADVRQDYKVTGHIARVRAASLRRVPLHQHQCMLVKMLTGTSSSSPTLGSKKRAAKQNPCRSSHDISSCFAFLSLIYNVSATESIWFHRAVE